MSRRRQRGVSAVPSRASLVWLGGLMLGVAVGVVLIYHFVLASHAGSYSAAKAAPAPVVQQDDLGDAHAEALREALEKPARK